MKQQLKSSGAALVFSDHQSFTVTKFGGKNLQASISSPSAELVVGFGLSALLLIWLFV